MTRRRTECSGRLSLSQTSHGRDRPLTTDSTSFTLGQAPPDPEFLGMDDRVFEAGLTHGTASAHLLRLARGCTTLGREEVGVDTEAVGVFLRAEVLAFGDG